MTAWPNIEVEAGVLYGIGLGPGNPRWVTVEAAVTLTKAEHIFYLKGLKGCSRAELIGRVYANPHAAVSYLQMPSENTPTAWRNLADVVAKRVNDQQRFAVACLGDPLLYGSLSQILPFLPASLPVKIIPGLWSGSVAAAHLASPWVTYQQSLVVLVASLTQSDLLKRLAGHQAAVILKVCGHEQKLQRVLATLNVLDRCWIISDLGTEQQRCQPFKDNRHTYPYFSLLWIAPPREGSVLIESEAGS